MRRWQAHVLLLVLLLSACAARTSRTADDLTTTTDVKIALLGNDAWELPIPLLRADGRWYFDVEAGREEVINRRVGRNELITIAANVCSGGMSTAASTPLSSCRRSQVISRSTRLSS